jgi:hypothetical protein
MAHFARVSREMMYDAQPPFQFDENARLLQQNMAQSNGPGMEQPTWQQEQLLQVSKVCESKGAA